MARAGGEADKLGNRYEAIWTVDSLLDVFIGEAQALTTGLMPVRNSIRD